MGLQLQRYFFGAQIFLFNAFSKFRTITNRTYIFLGSYRLETIVRYVAERMETRKKFAGSAFCITLFQIEKHNIQVWPKNFSKIFDFLRLGYTVYVDKWKAAKNKQIFFWTVWPNSRYFPLKRTPAVKNPKRFFFSPRNKNSIIYTLQLRRNILKLLHHTDAFAIHLRKN